MVELKDRQQEETEDKLQHWPHLILMEHTFASLKIHNLKVGDLPYKETALTLDHSQSRESWKPKEDHPLRERA